MSELSRSRGNQYALSALKNRRAFIASEIVEIERKLRHLRESLVHVDATLLILNPDANPEAIPNKRPTRRVKLFRQGELGRMILDALRQGSGDGCSAREIVDYMLRAGGHGEDARRAVAARVRGNLSYLMRRGATVKDRTPRGVIWKLRGG